MNLSDKSGQLSALRADAAFPLLASPIKLAGLEIPNRLAMAAMSSVLGSDAGAVTPELIGYYQARAEGGAGLITVEFSCVDRRYGRAEPKQLLIDDDRLIGGHRQLVDAIQTTGMRAAIQLHAPGQFAEKTTLEGMPAGPSGQYSRRDATKQLCRALENDEILGLIESYGRAARRSVAAGYEAIEIHGAHGYLPMAFMSPLKNLRDDEWGGDEERRLRFALEVIRAIKAELGPERPLIYRLSSTDFLPGGLSLDDMVRIAPQLVAAGSDAIHVSSGTLDGTLDRAVDPMSMPEGWRFEHSRAIKAVTQVPVMAVGPVRWPATAEAALERGDVDMVALGRPLLADPAWPRKAFSGNVSHIRPCTNCNWCFERVIRHKPIGCAENPRAGAEIHLPQLIGGSGQRVVVVGGGPGGMAAALDLAEAGFMAELYEASAQLGGGLIASATPPLKDKLFWYRDHLKARLADSSVTIQLGVRMTPATLLARNPAAVVLATGARATQFPIPGVDGPNVLSAYDLLMSEVDIEPSERAPVIVYGGGETGCETAEYLAEKGCRVVLVTRSAARDLSRSAEGMYRKHLLARLNKNSRITIREKSTITAVGADSVQIVDANGEHNLAASHVVLAQGRQIGSELTQAMADAGIPFVLVGDVENIGRIGDAVHAARRAVIELTVRIAANSEAALINVK
jgi:2,4-dienoyl-CoA reductase-like NADH-dependent reductase (Old Yellow Enzyme family)